MVYWSELQGAKHSNTLGIASICNAADHFKRPFYAWRGLSEQALICKRLSLKSYANSLKGIPAETFAALCRHALMIQAAFYPRRAGAQGRCFASGTGLPCGPALAALLSWNGSSTCSLNFFRTGWRMSGIKKRLGILRALFLDGEAALGRFGPGRVAR